MKKRVVEKIMAMLLVAGMLGGCGQSDAGTGNNVEEKNVQKNEETENSVLEDSGGKKASIHGNKPFGGIDDKAGHQ